MSGRSQRKISRVIDSLYLAWSRTQMYALIRSHQMEYLGVYLYINFVLGKRAINFYLFYYIHATVLVAGCSSF